MATEALAAGSVSLTEVSSLRLAQCMHAFKALVAYCIENTSIFSLDSKLRLFTGTLTVIKRLQYALYLCKVFYIINMLLRAFVANNAVHTQV